MKDFTPLIDDEAETAEQFHALADRGLPVGWALPPHRGVVLSSGEARLPMISNADRERWSEALAIERQHGDGAPIFIAERIGALALAGDLAGVERLRQIAARLDRLREPRQFLLA